MVVENFTWCRVFGWGKKASKKCILEREPEADQTGGVRSGESLPGSKKKIIIKIQLETSGLNGLTLRIIFRLRIYGLVIKGNGGLLQFPKRLFFSQCFVYEGIGP